MKYDIPEGFGLNYWILIKICMCALLSLWISTTVTFVRNNPENKSNYPQFFLFIYSFFDQNENASP